MNEALKQTSKGYETARTKGIFKTKRQTKQIYIYNKTYIDTLKILLILHCWQNSGVCICVCVCV